MRRALCSLYRLCACIPFPIVVQLNVPSCDLEPVLNMRHADLDFPSQLLSAEQVAIQSNATCWKNKGCHLGMLIAPYLAGSKRDVAMCLQQVKAVLTRAMLSLKWVCQESQKKEQPPGQICEKEKKILNCHKEPEGSLGPFLLPRDKWVWTLQDCFHLSVFLN